jgi:hypothetical protein
MKLSEIHRSIGEGLKVHWQNYDYEVVRAKNTDKYYIKSLSTGHCISLTWGDGITINGKEEEFFAVQP